MAGGTLGPQAIPDGCCHFCRYLYIPDKERKHLLSCLPQLRAQRLSSAALGPSCSRRSAARSPGDPAEFTRRGSGSAGQLAPLTSLPGSSAPQPRETQKRGARGPDSPWATRVAARCRAKPHRARSHWPQVAALRPTGSPSCALIIGPRPCGPPRIGSGGGPEELPLATGAACPRGLAVETARFRPCPARPPPRAPPKFRGVGAAGAVGPALRAPFRVPPSAPPGNPALRGGLLAMVREPWTRR
ncbi:hypothetical protein LEMLEM_LOCUS5786 [Lemmus lemmus]